MKQLSVEHLLGIKYINKNDIDLIFETANYFKEVINRPIKKVPSLRDITIANLFLKTAHVPNYLLNWQRKDFPQMSSISQQGNLL